MNYYNKHKIKKNSKLNNNIVNNIVSNELQSNDEVIDNITRDLIQNIEMSEYTRAFKGTIHQFKLNEINKILICIGGPIWEPELSEYIDKLNNGTLNKFIRKDKSNIEKSKLTIVEEKIVLDYIKENNIIGFIPKGENYTVKDKLMFGSGEKVKKEFLIEMKILPNYINTIF